MMDKNTRLAEVIKELAAEFVSRESNRTSLITITRPEVQNRGKKIIIYFTVMPDSDEAQVLEFLQRKRGEFRKILTEKKIVGFAPQIEFKIDFGEKNRQRIDELSPN